MSVTRRVLITGGSGNLGKILTQRLLKRGVIPIILDIRAPKNPPKGAEIIQGSISDRATVELATKNIDTVIHIAAWHGVHEFRKEKDEYDFWDVNVNGTFQMLEAAARQKVKNFLFISSTSLLSEPDSIYGHSKILGENLARMYHKRHGLNVIILRPRMFIPWWDRNIYQSYIEWCQWYWKGAVHINDVANCCTCALQVLWDKRRFSSFKKDTNSSLSIVVDGKFDYSQADLDSWDSSGPGSTFKKVYGEDAATLCKSHGLDISQRPKIIDTQSAERLIGYKAEYSVKNLLSELKNFEDDGIPHKL